MIFFSTFLRRFFLNLTTNSVAFQVAARIPQWAAPCVPSPGIICPPLRRTSSTPAPVCSIALQMRWDKDCFIFLFFFYLSIEIRNRAAQEIQIAHLWDYRELVNFNFFFLIFFSFFKKTDLYLSVSIQIIFLILQ